MSGYPAIVYAVMFSATYFVVGFAIRRAIGEPARLGLLAASATAGGVVILCLAFLQGQGWALGPLVAPLLILMVVSLVIGGRRRRAKPIE